jgi:hypothetical protein
MHRLALISTLLLLACRHELAEDRAPMLHELCVAYCPDRIACVDDGFLAGDVDACVDRCSHEERFLEDDSCGEASFAALECLAGLGCGELPTAVRAAASNTETIPCRAELLKEQDLCDFKPLY